MKFIILLIFSARHDDILACVNTCAEPCGKRLEAVTSVSYSQIPSPPIHDEMAVDGAEIHFGKLGDPEIVPGSNAPTERVYSTVERH